MGTLRVSGAANGLTGCRAGIAVVGLRHAVDRNRARRRIRAALRAPMASCGGLDLVVTAGMASLTAPFSGMESDLTHAMRQLAERLLGAEPTSTPK